MNKEQLVTFIDFKPTQKNLKKFRMTLLDNLSVLVLGSGSGKSHFCYI